MNYGACTRPRDVQSTVSQDLSTDGAGPGVRDEPETMTPFNATRKHTCPYVTWHVIKLVHVLVFNVCHKLVKEPIICSSMFVNKYEMVFNY